MNQHAPAVMVVDDSRLVREALADLLERANYIVIKAGDAQQALALARDQCPDLFLLDVVLPGTDGFALCRRLKTDPSLHKVPVLFITGRDNDDEVVRGFEVGAQDYITKPWANQVVLARVDNSIRLYRHTQELERLRKLALDASPLTGLPGNNSILKAIQAGIDRGKDQAVIYCDLDNFKGYNDAYGFSMGDRMIVFAAELFQDVVSHYAPGAFVGHVGGDDFVLITPGVEAEAVGREIASRFDREVLQFYSDSDRAQGFIASRDRDGQPRNFPFVGVSMAGTRLRQHGHRHYLGVADACSSLKKKAKAMPGSVLVMQDE